MPYYCSETGSHVGSGLQRLRFVCLFPWFCLHVRKYGECWHWERLHWQQLFLQRKIPSLPEGLRPYPQTFPPRNRHTWKRSAHLHTCGHKKQTKQKNKKSTRTNAVLYRASKLEPKTVQFRPATWKLDCEQNDVYLRFRKVKASFHIVMLADIFKDWREGVVLGM